MGYSLRELAKVTGYTEEAIRHLVKQRVLPPTTPRGPKTVYDEVHRLRLVALTQLTEKGFTRRAITEQLDAASEEELKVLAGIVLPSKPAPAEPVPVVAPVVAPPPKPPPRLLVDGVVCAAAEAIDVAPGAMRVALLAAVRRARELELGLGEIEEELTKAAKSPRAPRSTSG